MLRSSYVSLFLENIYSLLQLQDATKRMCTKTTFQHPSNCTLNEELIYSQVTTGWTARYRIPVGTRFSACPDRPWGRPSLLYNGYRVFPGVKCGRGVLLTIHPLLVTRYWKSRAIPLPTLWATPGL